MHARHSQKQQLDVGEIDVRNQFQFPKKRTFHWAYSTISKTGAFVERSILLLPYTIFPAFPKSHGLGRNSLKWIYSTLFPTSIDYNKKYYLVAGIYLDILREFLAVQNALVEPEKTKWFMLDGVRLHRTSEIFNFLHEYFNDRVIALDYSKHSGSGID